MIIPAIVNRRSIRKFKPDPVSDELIYELLRAASFAPTAMNKRDVSFIIIRDPAVKEKLAAIFNKQFVQQFLTQAPVLIMPVSQFDQPELGQLDIAIASEHIMLQATELGLGSVWKYIAPDLRHEVKTMLDIPPTHHLVNVIPVGYPDETLPPHDLKEFD